MTLSTSSLVWVTVGTVFGFLFLLTCFMSAVKAVRDRQRIKARNNARRAVLSNGQVAKDDRCVTCTKKLRPNIILIHDREKEQRVKQGRKKTDSVSITSLSITTPGVGLPGDLNSSCKEITASAEMTNQSTSINCISGQAVDDFTVASSTCSDIACLVDKQTGDSTSGTKISVEIETQVIAYRRNCLTESGQSCGSFGNLMSAFSIPIPTVVDSVPFSNNCASRDTLNSPVYRHKNATNGPALHSDRVKDAHNFKSMLTTNDRASHCQQLRATTMPSFPGCSKSSISNRNNTLLHPLERRKELGSADISPRRNSYAVDLSRPACVEVPRKRRHSDDCRRVIDTSMSRIYQNAMRMRRFKRDGVDNMAYESLDDEGIPL